ncbi:MAG: hypothetical protein ACOCXM_11680, partial [Myxococcota bacterium]
MGRQGALVLCRKMASGCMAGVEAEGDRPRLVVDVDRAKTGERRFDGRVLRLARVVRYKLGGVPGFLPSIPKSSKS